MHAGNMLVVLQHLDLIWQAGMGLKQPHSPQTSSVAREAPAMEATREMRSSLSFDACMLDRISLCHISGDVVTSLVRMRICKAF